MKTHTKSGRTFEIQSNPIEVTRLHRPDTSWLYTDKAGHEHRWWVDGKPANAYYPDKQHSVPTLTWVFEEWGYYPDGERYEIGHHECQQCGEHVQPRYTSDTERRYIAGLKRFLVDGVSVDEATFKREAESELGKQK